MASSVAMQHINHISTNRIFNQQVELEIWGEEISKLF
jgi:hypothetical protein